MMGLLVYEATTERCLRKLEELNHSQRQHAIAGLFGDPAMQRERPTSVTAECGSSQAEAA